MASLKNATFLASNVSSNQVETFYVDDSYHVLTLDKRKNDVAARDADFFLRLQAGAEEDAADCEAVAGLA
jgi:carboxylesterase